MNNILITGGAGFIGSNLVHYWAENFKEDKIFVVDNLSYAANLKNIQNLINKGSVKFFKIDIKSHQAIKELLFENNINLVAHLAAESHVDRSIKSPNSFIESNINGTYFLLEAVREFWNTKGRNDNFRFLHVSTDEVFGSLTSNDKPFDENSNYDPSSPYSASKASSDFLCNAWQKTFKIPILISNCSNNYGPYQYPEKLIPLSIKNLKENKFIPIYGDGSNVRDWLFVDDHCDALSKILLKGKVGERYCIGGNNEYSNLELITMICKICDKLKVNLKTNPSSKLIKFVSDRPGHDYRYAINSLKIKSELGWVPKTNIEIGLQKTIEWYLQNSSYLN